MAFGSPMEFVLPSLPSQSQINIYMKSGSVAQLLGSSYFITVYTIAVLLYFLLGGLSHPHPFTRHDLVNFTTSPLACRSLLCSPLPTKQEKTNTCPSCKRLSVPEINYVVMTSGSVFAISRNGFTLFVVTT